MENNKKITISAQKEKHEMKIVSRSWKFKEKEKEELLHRKNSMEKMRFLSRAFSIAAQFSKIKRRKTRICQERKTARSTWKKWWKAFEKKLWFCATFFCGSKWKRIKGDLILMEKLEELQKQKQHFLENKSW
jgi:hypothetical protein